MVHDWSKVLLSFSKHIYVFVTEAALHLQYKDSFLILTVIYYI